MSRVRLMLIALGMAFAVPALTGADVPPVTTFTEPAACTPQPDPDYPDTRWVWRLRAYRHLDCVNAIVERALSSASRDRVELSRDSDRLELSRDSDRIELSRDDLERIRTEAWYARDAAARIGQ